ncbi:N-acetylmuramidase family protein [Sphingomonas sp. PB4P5]|uniref:N-acetylmuramidase family protein n=1 Tax=Parasphingomonas puruogangriensis TaxID=3096155 RepID=UPI002FCA90FC
MTRIAQPVGPGQPNVAADVLLVQQALARHRRWIGGQQAPAPSGTFDPATATAIVAFQREGAALKTPDGIVSPRGYTMTALERDAIPPLQHRIFVPMCWAHPNDALTEADFETAARDLNCEVAAIRAVADTEAKDSPWDFEGRPVILFERHKFATHTGGRFSGTHPDLSHPRYGGYGASRQQHERLRRAAMLDETAALKSASWGLFQILGENHVDAGYATVAAFVTGMMQSRANHLRAFVAFVGANAGMKRAIQQKDWAEFARRYNGPRYAENDYDGKMRRAYERLAPPPRVPLPRPRPATAR